MDSILNSLSLYIHPQNFISPMSYSIPHISMDHFLRLISYLFLQLAGLSHAATPAALLYWNSVLPNTPMPTAMKDLLQPREESPHSVSFNTQMVNYNCMFGASMTQVKNPDFFFLAEDMQPGAKKTMHFTRTIGGAPFIPRATANSIPFSSDKLDEILARFAIEPNSTNAQSIKIILQNCEEPAVNGETKYCATSLESMVEFIMSRFRTRDVQAISTVMGRDGAPEQVYTVESPGIQRIDRFNKLMACHYVNYVYAVFYCHTTATTEAYTVTMVGSDGMKVEAAAICHTDTSRWNPRHVVFRVLNVKPGYPVCHFMPQDHVVWTTN